MRKLILFCILINISISCTRKTDFLHFASSPSEAKYFGKTIIDPYSNLDDIEDSTVIKYIQKYNTYTNKTLEKLDSGKQKLLQKLHDFENSKIATYKNIQYIAGNVVYLKRDKDENTFKLYYKNPTQNITETLLYDPKDFEYQGKRDFLINYYSPNWDFSKVVISFTKGGNEFTKMIVWDVVAQKQINSTLTHCVPTLITGVSWLPNNNDFLYIRVNDTLNTESSLKNSATILYKSNENIDIDILSARKFKSLSIKDKDMPIASIQNEFDEYVIGEIAGVSKYRDTYLTKLNDLEEPIWKLIYNKEELINKSIIYNDTLFYSTSKGASNFKICKVPLNNANFDNPEILVDEKKDEVINQFTYKKNTLLYSKLRNGVEVKMYYLDKKGKEQAISLPYPAGNISFENHTDPNLLPITLGGWTLPRQRFIYNLQTQSFTKDIHYPLDIQTSFDDLMVEEVLVSGHDGEEIPLSLVYKKGLKRNGNTPVLMRAYGAYGVNVRPNFYYGFMLWVQEGGIYAMAHVRGGSEKGNRWYEQGKKLNKPNSWKDFISCTEFLINQKYSSPENMAIWSGSAGGVTLGRTMTERPDLYSAVILDRGIYNTVTIDEKPNGANNTKEFGSNKDSIEFKGLYEMDTYHHVKDQVAYPAILLTVGMNDSRVPPSESFKLATRLRKATSSSKPILLRTEFETGHGISFDRKDEEFDMISRVLSFAFWQTGHPEYQPRE